MATQSVFGLAAATRDTYPHRVFYRRPEKVPVGYWKARNANGAFINLSNAVVNDAVVLEIPRGEKTVPRRQLFDESVMIVDGQGA
ncbi:MAG TPA: hypothetical protein VGK65_15360, partial [Candidatus Binatia bacterium]